MIEIKHLSEQQLKAGVVHSDLFFKGELMLEKLLKDPQNIPYFFYEHNKPEIIGLGPKLDKDIDCELIIKNFYRGLIKLKEEVNYIDQVNSRIIFDPCGFGYIPIGDSSNESPRIFLATTLTSKKREMGLVFTLIRGGCKDKPSYTVQPFDNTEDILDIMEPYIQIEKSHNCFIPFRLQKLQIEKSPECFNPFRFQNS